MAVAVAAAVAIISSVTAGAAITAGIAALTAGSFFVGVGYLALGVIITVVGSLIATALNPGSVEDQDRVSRVPISSPNPPKRWAIGDCEIVGERIARFVEGDTFHGVYLFNSRPSAGPFDLKIDDRKVTLYTSKYNDAYNQVYNMKFGAQCSSPAILKNHMRIWIGRGDHLTPPKSWVDKKICLPTDIGKNCTIAWVRIKKGDAEDFLERWPNGANLKIALKGKWSKFIDPRDNRERYTETSAIVVYNLARDRLGLSIRDESIDKKSFCDGADFEESPGQYRVYTKGAKFKVAGVISFEDRNGDLLARVATSAGARIVPQGGKLFYIAAQQKQSIGVINDCLEPPTFTKIPSGEGIYNKASARFIDPSVWTTSVTPERTHSAGLVEDNNEPKVMSLNYPLCIDNEQAQWLAELALRDNRYQKKLMGVFPRGAIRYTTGDIIIFKNEDFPHISGRYEIISTALWFKNEPAGFIVGTRIEMRETSPDIYDESTFTLLPYTPPDGSIETSYKLAKPSKIKLLCDKTTAKKNHSNTTSPRVKISWQGGKNIRLTQIDRSDDKGQTWLRITEVTTKGAVDKYFLDGGVSVGETYQYSLRSVGDGVSSVWVETKEITVK